MPWRKNQQSASWVLVLNMNFGMVKWPDSQFLSTGRYLYRVFVYVSQLILFEWWISTFLFRLSFGTSPSTIILWASYRIHIPTPRFLAPRLAHFNRCVVIYTQASKSSKHQLLQFWRMLLDSWFYIFSCDSYVRAASSSCNGCPFTGTHIKRSERLSSFRGFANCCTWHTEGFRMPDALALPRAGVNVAAWSFGFLGVDVTPDMWTSTTGEGNTNLPLK